MHRIVSIIKLVLIIITINTALTAAPNFRLKAETSISNPENQDFSPKLDELPTDDLYQGIEMLKVTGKSIPWEIFKKTKEIEQCTKDKEGFDDCIIKPEYSSDIKKLSGQEVTLMGYMFPLEQSEKHKNFLFGPYPMSCQFHYHANPALVVEVLTKEPIEFSYEPITIKGNLSLEFNTETQVFYYLKDAYNN